MFEAGHMVESWTLGRVTDESLNAGATDRMLAQRNKRGVCEIADLLFRQATFGIGDAGVSISGFKNEGYSETFANTGAEESGMMIERAVMRILDVYFTPEQVCRKGGGSLA
jgi:hypothetical protein